MIAAMTIEEATDTDIFPVISITACARRCGMAMWW
jgi:hypothetical protein